MARCTFPYQFSQIAAADGLAYVLLERIARHALRRGIGLHQRLRQQGTRSIWQSDDGGTHWMQAGTLLAVVAQPGIILMAAGSSSSAVVYALPQEAVNWGVAGVRQIRASNDGGRTWTAAPTAELPAGVRPVIAASMPLPDGSLVVAFATGIPGTPNGLGSVSCFAWHPGAGTWQRVTPAVGVTSTQLDNAYVSTSQPLTVTLSVETGSDPTNPTYTLMPFVTP